MTSIKEVADSRFVTKQIACLVGTSTEPQEGDVYLSNVN